MERMAAATAAIFFMGRLCALTWRVASLGDGLLVGSEDRVALFVVHGDADGVAMLQEGGPGLSLEDRLDGANLGDAGVTKAAVGDRLARTAIGTTVGDSAGSEDRARADVPSLRKVRDERAEIEGHVDAGVGAAERLAVEIDL